MDEKGFSLIEAVLTAMVISLLAFVEVRLQDCVRG